MTKRSAALVTICCCVATVTTIKILAVRYFGIMGEDWLWLSAQGAGWNLRVQHINGSSQAFTPLRFLSALIAEPSSGTM